MLYMRTIFNLMDLASIAGGLISGINKTLFVVVAIFGSIKVNTQLIQIIMSQQLDLIHCKGMKKKTIENIQGINSIIFVAK